MRIAIPTKNDQIDNHFGHSDYFSIFELTSDSRIVFIERLETTKGCGCKTNLAGTLAEKGVNILIAGGIGGGAVTELRKKNIEVHGGYQGTVNEVLKKWTEQPGPVPFTICSQHEECEH